ncbi:MAG: serine/threonine protein kinase [Polyangiaceae bacterium]|nr:serine/threonine protein kinase [Polyangiaceae bacterium]
MAAPNKTKIPVGTVLAEKYRIEREIGRGGMATVYEAENIGIGKHVAIKVLAQELTGSSIVVERFLREARAAAAIRSPYICDVYDSGKLPSGQPFLVLELLEGESLYERMTRQRQLDVHTTVQVITQVCRGLTKAHAASIVHRDLKPENIFLTKDEDGRLLAKILDFGLAKFYTPTTKDQTRLTREGAVFGTPAYMSPEQVRGQGAVDHRADLWALGCITYECFTGKTVWSTDQGVAMTFAQIASAPLPRPARYRPDLPATFTEWFDQTLDRDINRRFQTAKEFAETLAISCGLERRESSEIRPSPIEARDEAKAALAAAAGPASPRVMPGPPAPPVRKPGTEPLDDGADFDGDPTRVLNKQPLVKPLETAHPHVAEDAKMERFRRGPDGRIAKIVPQVAPAAPRVPAALSPLPGSHRAPVAGISHGPASSRSGGSTPRPPHAAPPHPSPQGIKQRTPHAPVNAADHDSEMDRNPFAKARRQKRIVLILTLLVLAVVIALFIALSSSPPSSGDTVDTSVRTGAAPGSSPTAIVSGAPTASTSTVAPAPKAPSESPLPTWLADVREAEASLAAGDVKGAQNKLSQAASKSSQHSAVAGLIRHVSSAVWARNACTLTGVARPRTYDLSSASVRRVAATKPSVLSTKNASLVAWTDSHAGASHAYVVKLDGTFAPAAAPIDITPDGGAVERVELVAWGEKVLAVYTDTKAGAAGTFVRSLAEDGKPLGSAAQIGPAKTAHGSPTLFSVSENAVYAMWTDDGDRDSEDLFLQKLSSITLSPEGSTSRITDLFASPNAPRARALGARAVVVKDTAHIAFELSRSPAAFIQHQVIGAADLKGDIGTGARNREGKAVGSLDLVNVDKGRAHNPQIACNSDFCFIVWHGESPPGAQGAAFETSSGKAVWRRRFSPNANYPTVAASPSGGAVAAWIEDNKLVAAPLVRTGFSKTAKVGRASAKEPVLSLAVGPQKGQYLAAWLDIEGSVPEPYVARLSCP